MNTIQLAKFWDKFLKAIPRDSLFWTGMAAIICTICYAHTIVGFDVPQGYVGLVKKSVGSIEPGFTGPILSPGWHHRTRSDELFLVDVQPHRYTIPIVAHGGDMDLRLDLEVKYNVKSSTRLKEVVTNTRPDRGNIVSAEMIFRQQGDALAEEAARISSVVASVSRSCLDSPVTLEKYILESLLRVEEEKNLVIAVHGVRLHCVELVPCQDTRFKAWYHSFTLPGLGQAERPYTK